MKQADLDRVRALLLRASALRQGEAARKAAPQRPPTDVESAPRKSATAVDVALEKNRLHLSLQGFLDVAQAEAILLDIQLAVTRLRPGFDVISDVSGLGTLTAAAVPYVRRLVTALVEAGMRQMVRVVGSSPAGAVNVARAVEGLSVARVVASTQEAERLLDGPLNARRIAAQSSPPAPPSARRKGGRRRAPAPAPAAKGRR
jgi:hypothetical protein